MKSIFIAYQKYPICQYLDGEERFDGSHFCTSWARAFQARSAQAGLVQVRSAQARPAQARPVRLFYAILRI